MDMLAEPIPAFWQRVEESLESGSFVKLTLSKPVRRADERRNVFVRRITLRAVPHLSCTLRYERRDETRNFLPAEGIVQIRHWLEQDFYNADLFTLDDHLSLQYTKKRQAHLRIAAAQHAAVPEAAHDQPKQRPLEASGKHYLHALGITSADGQVLKAGQRKYKQINKYIEIIEQLLRERPLASGAHIVDMGSGKGYLTFALYDHLRHQLGLDVHVTGVEMRPELVELCHQIAQDNGFDQLQFLAGDIDSFTPAHHIDMLIALHACDTATDDALAKGIHGRADIIVAAPCCQKQVRRDLTPPEHLRPLLRHGILLERQAELLTDGLRALLLEAEGYRTKVFEFISTEHTPKNVMITATKGDPKPEAREEAERLKAQFGLKRHRLEELL